MAYEVAAIRSLEELANKFAAQTRFPIRRGSDAGRPSRFWTLSSTLATSRSAAPGVLSSDGGPPWLALCNVRTHALTKGLRPFFNQKRAPPQGEGAAGRLYFQNMYV